MKKLLFYMPDNPLKKNAGNKIRALSMLHYFQSRGFKVHFVSEHYWGNWTIGDLIEFQESGLADKITVIKRKPAKNNLLNYFFAYKLPEFFRSNKWGFFPSDFIDMVTLKAKHAFNKILKDDSFDYVVINYATWSSFIEKSRLLKGAKTVLDTHDFLTAQNKSKIDIGASFKEEMRRLSLFDLVLSISVEEQYIFSQFARTTVKLAPMIVEDPGKTVTYYKDRKFDLIYVASKNPHNVASFHWFMEEIYPLLPQSISICIVGEITEFVNNDLNNITSVSYADDLSYYYTRSKVAICPMLTGTGVKIKVVEAISYGLPVVCNIRGVDGLSNKSANGCLVTDLPSEFATNIKNLLTDVTLYNQQSEMARKTFRLNYEKEHCYEQLDILFGLNHPANSGK